MEMRSPTLTLSSVHPCSRSRGTLAPSRDHTMSSSLFSDYFHLGPVGNDIVYAEPQSKLPWIAALIGILFAGPGRADHRWRNAVFHLRESGQRPPKTGTFCWRTRPNSYGDAPGIIFVSVQVIRNWGESGASPTISIRMLGTYESILADIGAWHHVRRAGFSSEPRAGCGN